MLTFFWDFLSHFGFIWFLTFSFLLFQILLSKARFGEQFEEVMVDAGNSILQDLFVDKSQKYVYATSPYKVSDQWSLFFFFTHTCKQPSKKSKLHFNWRQMNLFFYHTHNSSQFVSLNWDITLLNIIEHVAWNQK